MAALVAAGTGDTVLTEAFHEWWPSAPHRVLRSAVAGAEAAAEIVGEVELDGEKVALPRWCVFAPTRGTRGVIGAMALYAGESVANVADVRPAGAIVRTLVDGAARLLRAATPEPPAAA